MNLTIQLSCKVCWYKEKEMCFGKVSNTMESTPKLGPCLTFERLPPRKKNPFFLILVNKACPGVRRLGEGLKGDEVGPQGCKSMSSPFFFSWPYLYLFFLLFFPWELNSELYLYHGYVFWGTMMIREQILRLCSINNYIVV